MVSFMPSITPKVEPMATSSSALQKTSPSKAGKKSTAAQPLAEARLERIDQRRELRAGACCGRRTAAQDQADAEAHAALHAEIEAV